MKYNQCLQARIYTRSMGDYINAFINKDLTVHQIGSNGVLAVNHERNVLPKVRLPMVMDVDNKSNTTGKTIVFQDMSGLKGEDADMSRLLGILTTAWESGEHRLTNIRKVGAYAYSKWISKTLTSRLGLTDFENLARMEVLLALYFYSAGRPTREVIEAPRTNSVLAEIANAGEGLVRETIELYVKLRGDDEDITFNRVVEVIKTLSPVFEQKINTTTIAKCVANGWLGEAGVFHSQLALEYPPAFFSGLYMAYASKTGFKRTPFGTLIQKTLFASKRSEKGEVLIRQLNDIIRALRSDE